jgi:hypothetical protein
VVSDIEDVYPDPLDVFRVESMLRLEGQGRFDGGLRVYLRVVFLDDGAAARNLVVAQSATAFSSRLKGEPNGYNVIDADDARLAVTVLRWVETGFETYQRTQYVRDGQKWRPLD